MKKILVVDDMAVFREPIAASLRLAGYEVLCAEDGEEALRITRDKHPDLLLLDVSMPVMDGIAVLKQMRTEPGIAHTPVILLTALSEKKHVMDAASFGVREYLLKSRFRLKELLARIEKVLSEKPPLTDAASGSEPGRLINAALTATESTGIPTLMTRKQFMKKIEGLLQAKALSGVTTQVISLASSPDASASELGSLISRDPMLSARIIKASNSAAYASRGPAITTINDAIRKIGSSAVRNIAAAIGVFDCMPDAAADGFNPIRCWQHSFAVAQLCERLASNESTAPGGLAYVIGLCHDLGDTFLRTQFGKEYQQVNDLVGKTGQPRDEVQRAMLGMTHSDMVGAVLKSMLLPDAIREPIEQFHSEIREQASSPLAKILWIAETYANAALLASAPNSEVAPLSQAFCKAVVGDGNPTLPDGQTLRSEVQMLTLTLGKLSSEDQAKLLVPMFERSRSKIWVACELGVSSIDPIANALREMLQVELHHSLPAASEIELIDGVVIVCTTASTSGFLQSDIASAMKKLQRAGRQLPVMAFNCNAIKVGPISDGIPWHLSITLSELATYANKVNKDNRFNAVA